MMDLIALKFSGLLLRHIFGHGSKRDKHLKRELEEIKLKCELLSEVKDKVTRDINKALVKGKTPPKIFYRWVEEANAIESQGNDIPKSDEKSRILSIEVEELRSMCDKVEDQLKKSPVEQDKINDRLLYINVMTRGSVVFFMGKTKMLWMRVTKLKPKATFVMEDGMSLEERPSKETVNSGQKPEKMHNKEGDVVATPFIELTPIIEEERKFKSIIGEIEELPLQENVKTETRMSFVEQRRTIETVKDGHKPEKLLSKEADVATANTVDVAETTEMTPGLSVQDKARLEPISIRSESSYMSTVEGKSTRTEKTTETQAMPVQTNEAQRTDVFGLEELAPGLSIQCREGRNTECEIIQVPSHETDLERIMMPLSGAETLAVEVLKTESVSADPEEAEISGTIPFISEGSQPIIKTNSASQNTVVEPIVSITTSIERRRGQFMDLQLMILPVVHSTKMHNAIKYPGFETSVLEESDYSVFIRTDEKIEMPEKQESNQGKISAGAGSSSSLVERPKRTNISLPDCILQMSHTGLTEPPLEKKWEQPSMIFLMENEFSSLPEKPNCPNLKFLFLQNNRRLRTISNSFFTDMPLLQVLDLSKTGVRSLPSSLFKRTGLLALLLRDCDNLDELPREIGNLQQIEVLDLRGTELYNLPDEISRLSHLRRFRVSFYGADDHSEYFNLPSDLVSCQITSKLLALETLSIVVHPADWRWNKSAEAITRDVGSLSKLTSLDFYFPEVKFLKLFVQISPSWKEGRISRFKFVVGQDIERIASRVPDNVVSEYDKYERCLRYVNGVEIPNEVVRLLVHVTAFYVDHHCAIKNLSEFGVSNFKELKFCVVRECPKIVEIIYNTEGSDIVLPRLQHLSMHYLWKLESIWKGSVPRGSLDRLRFLSVYTCPELKFVLTEPMLYCLSNLEELIVEDCASVEMIIKTEGESFKDCAILPSLKKMELHYLPKLVSLWNGIGPKLGSFDFNTYGFPKFEHSPD